MSRFHREEYSDENAEESETETETDSESGDIIAVTVRSKGGPQLPPRHTHQTSQEGQKSYKGWTKQSRSKQDEINAHPDKIKEKLLNFERIPPERYSSIETGTFIRYVRYDSQDNPLLRLGGYLIRNGSPDYWVLKAGSRGKRPITWSVPLKGNPEKGISASDYYMKRGVMNSRDDRARYGIEVYDALKSGRYMLVETEVLEELTGQLLPGRAEPRRSSTKQQSRPRFELDDQGDELERQPYRARFTQNETSSEDW